MRLSMMLLMYHKEFDAHHQGKTVLTILNHIMYEFAFHTSQTRIVVFLLGLDEEYNEEAYQRMKFYGEMFRKRHGGFRCF